MTELETYKRALQKISEYGIKPTGETELQRIKRLKSIADKALFIADVVKRSEQLVCSECSDNVLRIYEVRLNENLNYKQMLVGVSCIYAVSR